MLYCTAREIEVVPNTKYSQYIRNEGKYLPYVIGPLLSILYFISHVNFILAPLVDSAPLANGMKRNCRLALGAGPYLGDNCTNIEGLLGKFNAR